jgi:hypothetical protein
MRRSVIYGGLLLTVGVAAAAQFGLFGPSSGLPVGDTPGAFNVRDVTGQAAGGSICYR